MTPIEPAILNSLMDKIFLVITDKQFTLQLIWYSLYKFARKTKKCAKNWSLGSSQLSVRV